MYKLAFISPNKEAYSETFIKAQKDNLKGELKYYYGGFLPTHLEGQGKLKNSLYYYFITLLKRLQIIKSILTHKEYRLIRSFKQNKIDVVLAQYGQTGASCLNICKKLHLPLIVHFHGYDAVHKDVLYKYLNIYKEMFEYASYVIVVSEIMKGKLIEYGSPIEKIVLNHYGPNKEFEKIQPDFTSPFFAAVGRFADTKAPYYTIFAFHKVLQKFPNARLAFAGVGPLFGDCINIVKYLKIEHAVKFCGILSQLEVAELFSNSFCFVQHSITSINGDMEGTPNSVLESSMASLPVISTLHAGIPDVIIHDKTGFLVEEHDVEKMAEYMSSLFENRELAKKMGEVGRVNIKSNFTIEKYIEKLDKIIGNSVNRK